MVRGFPIGKTLFNKRPKPETDDFGAAVGVHFDKSAARRVGHLQELQPSLESAGVTDDLSPVLGGMQLQAFREVAGSGLTPRKGCFHIDSALKTILKGYCWEGSCRVVLRPTGNVRREFRINTMCRSWGTW